MKSAGICLLSCAPMRRDPSERSEMVSQLLFGEYFVVRETFGEWLYVRSGIDDYPGWVSARMIHDLPGDFPLASMPHVICSPYAICTVAGKQIHLPGGSLLPAAIEHSTFALAGQQYTFAGGLAQPDEAGILAHALQYLGAPYLWGGKTIFGIDCSGFLQIVCRMAGHWIPRDTCQQSQIGRDIPLEMAAAGDIAFFRNDNEKVTHTGILCSADSIIHASGCVRIDRFGAKGIFNEDEKRYTHKYPTIKRLELQKYFSETDLLTKNT